MCGIFGATGYELDSDAVDNVLRNLRHRGPDGHGQFVDRLASVTLAHTRLAVIDLVTGAQPLHSDDDDLVIVANGEIYDFERIRGELQARGHCFKTNSDSEVILHLYREFGLDCFDQLSGEFAFLLYDRAKQLLIAARDRFGIKPLYFARLPDGYVFGSEMKAIFASGLIAPELNAEAFDPLIETDSMKPQLPFLGIEHVPPGSCMVVDLGTRGAETTRYWSPEIPTQAQPIDAGAAANAVLTELETAVRLRLRADVPVGLYLSGGLDSALVGALMKRDRSGSVHSFSIAFADSDLDEGPLAKAASEAIGTDHHELAVTKSALWDHLEDALWFSELPFATLAPVGKFLLSAEARKFVKVILTGEGADEVFLGYRSFFKDAVRDTQDPGSQARSPQARRLGLAGLGGRATAKLSLLLFASRHRRRIVHARAAHTMAPPTSAPLINAVQEARIARMPFDILCFLGDREEMAHGIEGRLPFLDHRLYDTARSIPPGAKIRDGVEKAVLREAAKGLLPEDIRLRRKSGFMLTSEAVDLHSADRAAASRFGRLLSRRAFASADVFSYHGYIALSLLARLPHWTRRMKKLRRDANKAILYMMQVHMLDELFIARPRWRDAAAQTEPALGLSA